MPLVWTDGRSGGRAYVITKFFSEGKITSFSYPRCSAGRLRASSKTRLVHVIVFIFIENRSLVLNENGYLNCGLGLRTEINSQKKIRKQTAANS